MKKIYTIIFLVLLVLAVGFLYFNDTSLFKNLSYFRSDSVGQTYEDYAARLLGFSLDGHYLAAAGVSSKATPFEKVDCTTSGGVYSAKYPCIRSHVTDFKISIYIFRTDTFEFVRKIDLPLSLLGEGAYGKEAMYGTVSYAPDAKGSVFQKALFFPEYTSEFKNADLSPNFQYYEELFMWNNDGLDILFPALRWSDENEASSEVVITDPLHNPKINKRRENVLNLAPTSFTLAQTKPKWLELDYKIENNYRDTPFGKENLKEIIVMVRNTNTGKTVELNSLVKEQMSH